MTRIRVDPSYLRQVAQKLDDIASRIRALGKEAREITSNAPSHDGQFGPKARTMGVEAEARCMTQAERTTALSEELIARAAAFEDADQRLLEAWSQLSESMNEWMKQAYLTLSPFVMASSFPWLLIQRHLRLGSLMDPGGLYMNSLSTSPFGLDHTTDIPSCVWCHLPLENQQAILADITEEVKPDSTVRIPIVRPLL